MKRMLTRVLSAAAVVLLIGPGTAEDAGAKTRISATLHTPNVRVHVGNTSCSRCRRDRYGRYIVCKHHYRRIDHRDRKIAQRLAWYTGLPARRLIRLRRYGYAWFEIGRRFRLPRPVIRAAMHKRSWKRFLYEERHFARRGIHRYGRRPVVYFYDD